MNKAIAYLRSPSTIRAHCHQILNMAREGKLTHFHFCENHFEDVVHYVVEEMNSNYPDRCIPYHSRFRHFEAGGIDRIRELEENASFSSPEEWAIMLFELAIVSVLLDAGAGDKWSYHEPCTGKTYTRSEGLAVASFHMFRAGDFSSNPTSPLQVDAESLIQLTPDRLIESLQINAENPLVGIEGRVSLLNRLGHTIKSQSHFFGEEDNPQLGGLHHYLLQQTKDNSITAETILTAILEALSPIWPEGYFHNGINLGDVGFHPLVEGEFGTDGLIPFHKLSQWLSYSLFEPLEAGGTMIQGANQLTGLPEYRNGGLLMDMGVLALKQKEALSIIHSPHSELIVEWRALTVALLDELAEKIRKQLHQSEEAFPLVKALQGGTWSAGRKIAKKLRPSGSSPLLLKSTGTLF